MIEDSKLVHRAHEEDDNNVETVFSSLCSKLIEFHRDESSTDLEGLEKLYFGNIGKGMSTELGVGMNLSKVNSPPSVHMLNISAIELRQGALKLEEDITIAIKKYEHVKARTPSVEALKGMLVLFKDIAEDKQTKKLISNLYKEIRKLDLTKPPEDGWNRKIDIVLNNVSFSMDISINKIPIFDKAIIKFTKTDLSNNAKLNKYCFDIKIDNHRVRKTKALKYLEGKFDQLSATAVGITVACVSILVARTGLLAVELLTQNLFPTSPINGVLQNYTNIGSIGIGFVGAFFYLGRMINKISMSGKSKTKD